jgi:spore coat protein CotH
LIDDKYKSKISIVCLALTILFIVSTLFIAPKNTEATTSTSSKTQVLNKEKITEVNIEIKDTDWEWLLENATKEEYRSANVTINGETFYNVGLRPKGNSSLSSVANSDSDRFSLKIDFSKYVKAQTYHGTEKLALNNIMSDATYMKENISYDIYNFLGVPTPDYSYSNIKINGKDWGLYLGVEVIEENFIKNEFGSTEGNLYKPESSEIGGGGNAKGGMGAPPTGGPNQDGGGPVRFVPGGNGAPPMGQQNANQNNGAMMDPMQNNAQGNAKTEVQGNKQNPPQGNANTESQNKEQNALQGNGNGANNIDQGQNMPFRNSSSGGANLKYTDDNASSYSIVREGAIFKTTTDQEFKKVITMIKNLNDGTNLEQYLDVENILKYFAVNTFLVNLDSYSGGMYHNYYLYEKDGKFSIIPWDLNMSFAGFSMGAMGNNAGNLGNTENNAKVGNSISAQSAINFPIDNPVTGTLENSPLIGNLLKVDKYKELYHSYLQKIADEYFNNGTFEMTVVKNDKLISDYVKTDATAFYTYDEYKTAIKELINFGKDRTLSVTSQLSGNQPSTTYGNIETTVNLTNLGTMMGGQRNGGNSQQGAAKANKQSEGKTNGAQGNEVVGQGQQVVQMNAGENQKQGSNGQMTAMGGQESNMGSMPSQENMFLAGKPAMNGVGISSTNVKNITIQASAIVITLAIGLLFVFKFKRKR